MQLLNACLSSRRLLDKLLSSIQHIILITDLEGNILLANPAVKQGTGYTTEELEGKNLSFIFPSEDLTYLYPNLLDLAQKGQPFEEELMLMRKNETRFFASLVFRPFYDPDQKKDLLVISVQDIDKQKQLEKVLRQVHYDDLIKVANGIAHEIRNPLVGIGGFVNRLYKSCRDLSEHDKYYYYIMNNLKKIENLVKKVEFFAKTPKPYFKETPIENIVENALQPYMKQIEESKVEVSLDIQGIVLFVDPALVARVFSILVENALDALSEGGKIQIESRSEDNQCMIFVTDNGSGITSQDLAYIFNPFFSTKATGAGIDLAVAKRIMELHRGTIGVTSGQNEGTTFSLMFPLERRRSMRIKRLAE